jgi:hypothetical protein
VVLRHYGGQLYLRQMEPSGLGFCEYHCRTAGSVTVQSCSPEERAWLELAGFNGRFALDRGVPADKP